MPLLVKYTLVKLPSPSERATQAVLESGQGSRQDDPADPAKVFKWCLDKVVDLNGNYLTITYSKDRGQIYPKRIEYTGAPGSGSVKHGEILSGRPAGFRRDADDQF